MKLLTYLLLLLIGLSVVFYMGWYAGRAERMTQQYFHEGRK